MRAAVSAVILGCVALFGLAAPAGAAASPVSLVLPQGAAFAILGHSCGGIAEEAFATGFDPSSGYPAGDVHLQTTCSSGGRGSRPSTYTAWASVLWDFTAATVSDSALSSAPTGLNPSLTAFDANGNEVYNSANHAYLVLAPGYVPQPRLTGLSTGIGPSSGGTTVTVHGTGFTAATQVDFGTVAAAQFSITDDTTIVAVTPLEAGGTVDVTVVSAGGTSTTSAADQFTFVAAPTITGLSPNSGSTSGGYYITINGTNLSQVTSVSFGDEPVGFSIDGDTAISALVPATDAPDTANVSVTSVGGTSASSSASVFTYTPAVSDSVSPSAGKPGTAVTITGAGFGARESVRVSYATGLASPAVVTMCTATATATGTFQCKAHIPGALRSGPAGVHAITAVGRTTGNTATSYFDLA